MAITLDPTAPADAESPRQGAQRIRALTLETLELLSQGGGSSVTFSAAPFNVDTSGNVTIPTTISVPTPTAAAHAATKAYVDSLTATSTTYTGTASGTNSYAVTLSPVPPSLAALQGVPIYVLFTNGNTNVSTLNVNGFGAKPVSGGKIRSSKWYAFVYDGTTFQNLERVSTTFKDTAQTVTGQSLTNDNVLFMPMQVNEKWAFMIQGRVACSPFIPLSQLVYDFTGPTGSVGAFANTGSTIAATSAINGASLSPTFSASPGYMTIVGDIVTDATHSGLLQFRYCADAPGTSVIIPGNSNNGNAYLIAYRVSP